MNFKNLEQNSLTMRKKLINMAMCAFIVLYLLNIKMIKISGAGRGEILGVLMNFWCGIFL